MRTIAASLVFSVLMLLTGAAHTVPLRITEGEITANTVLTDIFSDFGGNGFEVTSVNPGIFGGDVPLAVGFPNDTSSVTVGSLTCGFFAGGPADPDAGCGFIQTTHGPLPLDQSEPFDTASAPFTATGHLNVGEGFDIVGQGIVEAVWCNDQPDPSGCVIDGQFFFPLLTVRYGFGPAAVPEPPTLLLVVASFGVLGALFSARFLRDRYAARTT